MLNWALEISLGLIVVKYKVGSVIVDPFSSHSVATALRTWYKVGTSILALSASKIKGCSLKY